MILSKTTGALKAQTQTKAWPYVIIFVGLLIGAAGPIFIRLAQSEGIPSLVVTAIRQVLAVILLTPFILSNYRHELRHLAARDLLFAALTGVVLALRFVLLFEAFNNTSVLIAGVLNGSGPLWVALTEILFLKTTFDRKFWLGLTLALAGGAIIGFAGFDGGSSLGNNPSLGVLYALGSALLSAFYLNVGRSVRARVSFWPYLWLIFLFAGIASLVAVFAAGQSLTGYSPQGYVWLVILTITAQLVGHGSMNYALAYVAATFVSISAQMGNVISATLAFLFFAELPGPLQFLGSVVIIAGVIFSIVGKSQSKVIDPKPDQEVTGPREG